MRHFTLILLSVLSINAFGQSKMNQSNKEILESFQAHNLPEITHHIINDRPSNGSTFYVGKTKYMLHMEVIREPHGYVDTRNIGYHDAGLMYVTVDEIIPKGNPRKGKYKIFRSYKYRIDNDGFTIDNSNSNIFFRVKYRKLTEKEKKEIIVDNGLSLPEWVYDFQEDNHNLSQSIWNTYQFLYAYDFENDKLMKVSDYIIGDRLGRAHSSGKVYPKRK